jgi:hypothetical protein
MLILGLERGNCNWRTFPKLKKASHTILSANDARRAENYLSIQNRDLCKTPPFAQYRRQAKISILEIFSIFLWLKFSPSLILNKIEHFSKVSNTGLEGAETG